MKKIYLITLCLLSFLAHETAAQNTISGKVFKDYNGNGVQDGYDRAIADQIVKILPGPVYTLTNAAGKYEASVPAGDYSISLQDVPQYFTANPATHTASFTTTEEADSLNYFALIAATPFKDLKVELRINEDIRLGDKNFS